MGGQSTAVRDALVVLHHIELRAQGRLRLYNEREAPAGSIYAKTNSKGLGVLSFSWEPLQLGNVADTEEPKYQLNIRPPGSQEGYCFAPTIYEGRLIFVVSLRAVADGRIPDPRNAIDEVLAVALETDGPASSASPG